MQYFSGLTAHVAGAIRVVKFLAQGKFGFSGSKVGSYVACL